MAKKCITLMLILSKWKQKSFHLVGFLKLKMYDSIKVLQERKSYLSNIEIIKIHFK